MRSSGALVVSAGAIVTGTGSTTAPIDVECFGVALYDLTGDAILKVYEGVAATSGKEIAILGACDEDQSPNIMFPESIPCRGCYYSLVGGDALAIVYFSR